MPQSSAVKTEEYLFSPMDVLFPDCGTYIPQPALEVVFEPSV